MKEIQFANEEASKMREGNVMKLHYTEIRNPIKSISQNQSHEIFTQQKIYTFEKEEII
jgi:hypothetical protein